MIRYFKGEPNVHVIKFRNGTMAREGRGINFWYNPLTRRLQRYPPRAPMPRSSFPKPRRTFRTSPSRAPSPTGSTIPWRFAGCSISPSSRAPAPIRTKIPRCLPSASSMRCRPKPARHVAGMPLETALTEVGHLASDVLVNVAAKPGLAGLGVTVESLHFTSVRATPETQKALETEYRERLQGAADQAIYARRAAAVAEERKIQESELATEVGLENQREELVDMQARNKLALAEADAKAEELKLEPYGELPPQALIGLALKDWAANAGSIDNLSITPDLLSGLVGWMTAGKPAADAETPKTE